ncbi:MAG: hypothetical protein Q7S27_06995 [Nanoarchaeota archaeon]|nr:hypothetical protein [Nanoarchaeota archaeon]
MSKDDGLNKLVKLLTHGLSHKIGSIVNKDSYYSEKYAKEAINFFNLAKKVSIEGNWNRKDLDLIEKLLRKKLIEELKAKSFLDEKKFEFVDFELEKCLKELELILS